MEKNDTLSSDLERRKHVRLRVRDDLTITPQKYEGRTYYVVKDPVSLRYYRFKEQEHFLFKMLNGKHTLDETQKEFERRFRPHRLTLEDLEQFGQQLLKAGLAQNENPNAGQQLYERKIKRRRTEIAQKFTNILYIKIPIFDPERLLVRMLRYTRWMFSTWFLLFSIGVMAGALFLVMSHFQTFRDKLPSYYEFFTLKTMMYMWVALGVVKIIHEFGHGLSCKAFGGEVHEMGFLFLCLSPCMYCNVSDAWMLPSKWKRIIISGAGIYIELMIAAIATYVWWNTPHLPFTNNMALSLMVVCSVSTIVFNGNPLMRFDGYYVMSDLLEIPNLRERSNRYIKRLAMEHCLGIEMMPEPYMALGRRILFVTYAVCSYLYRWIITFVILKFIATFLKPYKLEIISNMLAAAAIASMFGWPLVRLIKGIKKRGRLPDMKPVRVTISAGIVASLLLAFFFLPLPVSQVRETGLVQVDPNQIALVRVEITGILEEIHVEEGQQVVGGITPLATFSSLELSAAEDETRTTYNIKDQFVQKYKAILDDPRTKRKDKQRIQVRYREAVSERNAAQTRLNEIIQKAQQRLVLKAPRDGIVFNVPSDDEIGKLWEEGKEAIFCKVGNPNNLRVLVPVGPADYDVIRRNEHRQQQQDKTLPVVIRPQGADNRTYKGQIVFLPAEEAQTIPLPLASKFGGPLATRPMSRDEKGEQRLLPQSQVYLLGVQFTELDGTIQPGSLAQVKIRCEYRSLAWWVWRKLAGAFDLGLW